MAQRWLSSMMESGFSLGMPKYQIEIEVTPAMIDVGSDILAFYDPETDRLGETVTQIFLAMLEARPSLLP